LRFGFDTEQGMGRLTSFRILLCTPLVVASALFAQPPEFRWERGDSSVALLANGKTVWRFRHGRDLPKPIFHPLALMDGTVLTWDSPPDHLWHHALWFSWKYLNHVNYWEGDPREPRRAGRAPAGNGGVTDWGDPKIATRGDFSAGIALDLSYHEPARPVILREHREVEVSAPDPAGEYHLDWMLTFTAGEEDVFLDRTPIPGEKDGVPSGGYAGLSIRFAKDFVDWKTVTTTTPAETDRRVGFYCESGAVGVDFSGAIFGQEAGVALLDHPENLNSPTPWYFVMQPQTPFLFAEAAVIYYKPYLLKAGQSFTLRYRTAVHRGRWDPARLKAAHAEYVKEMKKRRKGESYE
jgi:hypothetical protein